MCIRDSSKGVGRFLSRMIKDYVSNTDINTNNWVDIEFTNDLLTNVNTKLEKTPYAFTAVKINFRNGISQGIIVYKV